MKITNNKFIKKQHIIYISIIISIFIIFIGFLIYLHIKHTKKHKKRDRSTTKPPDNYPFTREYF